MKNVRITGTVVLLLVLLLSLSALQVAAADAGPSNAINLDNQRHEVPANSALWFRFDYTASATGTQPPTTLRMILGNKQGLTLDVWTPDATTNWPNSQVFAQGAPYPVDGNTGLASAQGGCESNDLLWSGILPTTGVYYARVTNSNTFNVRVYLTGSGTGLNLSAPAVSATGANPVPAPVPVTGLGSQPSTAAIILSNLDDPAKSFNIDGQPRTLAPKSAVWYRFDYGADADGNRPTKTIRLVNGDGSGVSFEVRSGDNLDDWWDKQPIGRGTASSVSCDNGEPAGNTGCVSNDLVWVGAFANDGPFYVRVYNDNLQATPFNLTIQ